MRANRRRGPHLALQTAGGCTGGNIALAVECDNADGAVAVRVSGSSTWATEQQRQERSTGGRGGMGGLLS